MNHAEHRTIVKLKTLQPQNPRLLGGLNKTGTTNSVSIRPSKLKETSTGSLQPQSPGHSHIGCMRTK